MGSHGSSGIARGEWDEKIDHPSHNKRCVNGSDREAFIREESPPELLLDPVTTLAVNSAFKNRFIAYSV